MKTALPDLSPFFTAYESIVAEANTVFDRVYAEYSDCVTCHAGCSDCCHALFDLSLIEALYINHAFTKTFDFGPRRSAILSQAALADRDVTRLKKQYFRSLRDAGPSEEALRDVFDQAAIARVQCPLLAKDGLCLLYDARPITCRLYGIPTVIGGKAHVCGKARFEKGGAYPTVHIEKLQDKLDTLSYDLQKGIQSRYKELHKVYVPMSMALLTNYDAAYLGIGPEKK